MNRSHKQLMLELARKLYPVSDYADATDKQLLTWLAEDVAQIAWQVKS